jgi:hypothetical protein
MKTPLIAASVLAYTVLAATVICYAGLAPALNPTF